MSAQAGRDVSHRPFGQSVSHAIQRCGIGSSCDCSSSEKAAGVGADVLRIAERGGSPLPDSTRLPMQLAFGTDFSGVRLHTDDAAHDAASSLSALALTTENHILFQRGISPGDASGNRILAHELAHVVQQRHGQVGEPLDHGLADPLEQAADAAADDAVRGVAVAQPSSGGGHPEAQRFTSCTRARLSLEECPRRQPGERTDAEREPMVVDYITASEEGFVVRNFAIGRSALKPGIRSKAAWKTLIQALSEPGSSWEILGLSDCEGADSVNISLRAQRAHAVMNALPSGASAQISGVRAAPLVDCLTDNTSQADRAFNRSVLIRLAGRSFTFPPDVIEGNRPVPPPAAQPTSDCTASNGREIAAAKPIAVAMATKALDVLGQRPTPTIDALLQRYFNDSSVSTRLHVIAGFRSTLVGLKSSVTFECEHKGSFMYEHFCGSSPTTVTLAYVRPYFGLNIHLCEAAFGRSDLSMAHTIVHEASHMFDFTSDNQYCGSGCSASLDRWSAYDNADSYAGFARDAYLTL